MSETVEGCSRPERSTDAVEPHEPRERDNPHEPNEHTELNALDALDDQLIALILQRSRQARNAQRIGRASGRPMTPLARENEMLRRYARHLGREGTAIAMAVLTLSRRP
ncbi:MULTISPECIES: chorismate mutase [Streptomyces]|uniref:Chorismate mutase n=1 Tax=Streptomyces cremeus TaxID=66881 RepID=A0ABV5PEW6_STRCM